MNELLSFYSLWKSKSVEGNGDGEEFRIQDLLSYHFTLNLTVCQIEDKCQKAELIKWILFKKKQFLYLLHLTVQCQITERCSYIIIISKKNEAAIENFGVFNYYISEENRNMNFKFKNDFIIYFT